MSLTPQNDNEWMAVQGLLGRMRYGETSGEHAAIAKDAEIARLTARVKELEAHCRTCDTANGWAEKCARLTDQFKDLETTLQVATLDNARLTAENAALRNAHVCIAHKALAIDAARREGGNEK